MANPTTNFGWVMPTATDLVTDLPADFDVFGQGVDTSLVDLLGGTTGQVLAKASGTDLDFVWSADAAGMTNPMTTTADIIYSSSGSTPARLGIGSTSDVLTVAGGVPTWAAPAAGGMTLLSTTTLSGASTTISSIDQTYKNLEIVISGVTFSADHTVLRIAPNGTTNISDYAMVRNIAGTGASAVGSTASYIDSYSAVKYNDGTNAFSLTIINYADATYRKSYSFNGYFVNSDPVKFSFIQGGGINTATAISSLVFSGSANTFGAGQVKVYGVK